MAGKAGTCGLARGNVIQKFRVCTVRNDHVGTAAGHHAGGAQLGGHAAGAKGGARAVGQCHHRRGDLPHQRDELCIRVGVGIGRVQAVDVAQQHQQVGLCTAGHDGRQCVVVADGGDLIGGNGVVFVDDGQGTQLQKAG